MKILIDFILKFLKSFFNLFKNIFFYLSLFLIKIYQVCVSPFFPERCNFKPSCSEYTVEAIKIHGLIKGFYLSCKRISKCNPNRSFTYDPVPKKIKKTKSK